MPAGGSRRVPKGRGSRRTAVGGARRGASRRTAVAGAGRRGGAPDARSQRRIWLGLLREGIAIAVANPVRFVYVNRALAEYTGYTRSELLALRSREIRKLIHPEDRRLFFERFRARLAGEGPPAHYEVRGLTKSGQTLWLIVHSTRIEHEGRPAVLAAFTDTTALKRAEHAMRENAVKLEAQYKGIPIPTYTWQRRGKDFILVDFNDAAVKITRGKTTRYLGVTHRELFCDAPDIRRSIERCFREKTWEESEMGYRYRSTGELKTLAVKYGFVPPDLVLVHTEDVTAQRTAEAKLLRQHEELEERIVERTAELRRINERLKREVAERKKAEEMLRASETRYRAIVEDQTELIVRFKPDTSLTFANAAACRFLNMPRSALIGKKYSTFLSKENRAFIKEKLATLTPSRPVEMHDQETVFSTGEVIWQQWMNRAFFDTAGRVIEYQAVGRDITARKSVEKAMERSNRELGAVNEINAVINSSAAPGKILERMLSAIAEYCGSRYAGLYEVDRGSRALNLVATCGVPERVRRRVVQVSMSVPSVEKILANSGVVVTEEDIPRYSSGEFDSILRSLKIRRVLTLISRSRDLVNFIVFLGWQREERVGSEVRRFLGIVGNQLGIALERLRLVAALEQSRAELKKLTSSLLSTGEEERRRIAVWLHDDIGQDVVALNFEFDLLEKRILAGEPVVPAALAKIRGQLRDVTAGVRQISYSLHPPMLDELGLITAIQRYVERFIRSDDLAVTVEATGFDEPLSPAVGITLYRVAQEALTNVVRHARASRVAVRITKGYPRVIMKIEDNGKGFTAEGGESRSGIGILGMRERVERLGGDFSIRAVPGTGTSIRVRLPLEVEDAG